MTSAPSAPSAEGAEARPPLDVPWWARSVLGAAAGALVGLLTTAVAGDASRFAKLLALAPALSAVDVAISDLGRRRLSWARPLVAAVIALALSVNPISAALAAILLGGWLASRIAAPGRHRDTRRLLLFGAGAVAGPVATLITYNSVRPVVHGDPLPISLAAFQLLFWLPVAAADAILSWSAARSRFLVRGRAAGLDPEELADREARTLAAIAAELSRRIDERAASPSGPEAKDGAAAPGGEGPKG